MTDQNQIMSMFEVWVLYNKMPYSLETIEDEFGALFYVDERTREVFVAHAAGFSGGLNWSANRIKLEILEVEGNE